MICVWSMNSSGSNWAAKMLSSASASVGGGNVCIEPWARNAQGPVEWEKGGPLVEAVNGCTDLLGRWPGRNETLADEDRPRIAELLSTFQEKYPNAAGFKTLIFPYPEVWREVWPGCPVVSLSRGLTGFLCCLARRTNRWGWYTREPWWYDIGDTPP